MAILVTAERCLQRRFPAVGCVFVTLVALLGMFVPFAQHASGQTGQELLPSRAGNFSYGTHVALDGNVAVVSGFIAMNPTFNSEVQTIDVYRYNGSTWEFEQHLFSSDNVFYNDLGNSVDVEGNLITVGAAHTGKGAVVTFRWNGSTWEESNLIQPMSPTSLTDNFGDVHAISGDVLIAPDNQDWDGFVERQLAYAFRYDGSAWQLEDTLKSSAPYANSGFGISAAVSGDLIVVGDPFHSTSASVSREGQAHIYDAAAGSWTESQTINAGTFTVPDARFGQSVATDGSRIVVGAQRDSVGDIWQAGSAYVFEKQGGNWTFTQRLTASDAKERGYFGLDAAVDGDYMIVGAPNDFRPGFVNDGGRAYFYRHNGSQWVERTLLALPDAASDERFGLSVDIDDQWVIVGAPGQRQEPWKPGAAYIYPVATLVSNESATEVPRPDATVSVYPNPVGSRASVAVTVKAPTDIRVEVFDLVGRLVQTVQRGRVAGGSHTFAWDPDDLPRGVYLVKLTAATQTAVTTAVVSR